MGMTLSYKALFLRPELEESGRKTPTKPCAIVNGFSL